MCLFNEAVEDYTDASDACQKPYRSSSALTGCKKLTIDKFEVMQVLLCIHQELAPKHYVLFARYLFVVVP